MFSKCHENWHATHPVNSCHSNPSPSDPMESICWHFPPPPQLYFDIIIYLSALQTDMQCTQWIFVTSRPVFIESHGVHLLTFFNPSTSLRCIFKCLANWHLVRPIDSCHRNPSPWDPMEYVGSDGVSLSRFTNFTQLYFALYLIGLSQTDFQ